MIEFDLHDVVEARYRPIRAIGAVGMAVHRVFPPQPLEMRRPGIFAVEARVTDIDMLGHAPRPPLGRFQVKPIRRN